MNQPITTIPSPVFRLCAVVVTYFPDVKEATSNILRYLDQVDCLIIWENTPLEHRQNHRIEIENPPVPIVVLGTDKNTGMSNALNSSAKWAMSNGYTHLLCMDQDSVWSDFPKYIELTRKNVSQSNVAMFIPNISNTKQYTCDVEEVNEGITSGSILSLDIFTKIGGFREDYFIDAVDVEYCLWLRRNGYKILRMNSIRLFQEYGKTSVHRLLGRTFTTRNYSKFRVYLIARNHIFLWLEYPEISFHQKKQICTEYTLYRFSRVLCFERDKFAKIFALIKGITHGILQIGMNRRQAIEIPH